jgi:hypothetical protein
MVVLFRGFDSNDPFRDHHSQSPEHRSAVFVHGEEELICTQLRAGVDCKKWTHEDERWTSESAGPQQTGRRVQWVLGGYVRAFKCEGRNQAEREGGREGGSEGR